MEPATPIVPCSLKHTFLTLSGGKACCLPLSAISRFPGPVLCSVSKDHVYVWEGCLWGLQGVCVRLAGDGSRRHQKHCPRFQRGSRYVLGINIQSSCSQPTSECGNSLNSSYYYHGDLPRENNKNNSITCSLHMTFFTEPGRTDSTENRAYHILKALDDKSTHNKNMTGLRSGVTGSTREGYLE